MSVLPKGNLVVRCQSYHGGPYICPAADDASTPQGAAVDPQSSTPPGDAPAKEPEPAEEDELEDVIPDLI